MTFASLFAALESWPLSAAVRGETPGTEWLFPAIETLHVLALALVFGTIAIVDLRLLGTGPQSGTPFSRLAGVLLRWTWGAFACAAVSGGLMFVSKASTYAGNTQFRMKFLFIALAGLNMVVLHLGTLRRVAEWDTGPVPAAARAAGALSLACWVGVVFCGRWVGFTT